MRITHEADYAIRVTYCLALTGGKQCAKDISELTGVTLRFALKILRKLTQSGITKSYKGVAFSVECENFVVLRVTQADPSVKGNTATNATKPATLETGAEVKVPLFINEGDKIKIDTRSGEYLERAKG